MENLKKAILEDRVRTLTIILEHPCECEKRQMRDFVHFIENLRFEAECKLESYEN